MTEVKINALGRPEYEGTDSAWIGVEHAEFIIIDGKTYRICGHVEDVELPPPPKFERYGRRDFYESSKNHGHPLNPRGQK